MGRMRALFWTDIQDASRSLCVLFDTLRYQDMCLGGRKMWCLVNNLGWSQYAHNEPACAQRA